MARRGRGEEPGSCRVPKRPRCDLDKHAVRGGANNGPDTLTVTDPEVLDCSICYEFLTIPVYQCENGHVACTNCYGKVSRMCPFCRSSKGYSRCRAIEKVLESIQVKCPNNKYGCNVIMINSEKREHEKKCYYTPCSCPFPGCSYIDLCYKVRGHFHETHQNSALSFHYNNVFHVTLNVNDKFLIFQEKEEELFVLKSSTTPLGKLVSVRLISHGEAAGCRYDIFASYQRNILRIQSRTEPIQKVEDSPPSMEFFLIPTKFFSPSGQLELEICIWQYSESGPNLRIKN